MMRDALWALGILALRLGAPFVFGGREPVVAGVRFDPKPFEQGVAAYFEQAEADVPNWREGAQKRVIWTGGQTRQRLYRWSTCMGSRPARRKSAAPCPMR